MRLPCRELCAVVVLAACGGRTGEPLFDSHFDASTDARGPGVTGAGGSVTMGSTSFTTGPSTTDTGSATTGAGGTVTVGAGGAGGMTGGSGGTGGNPDCNPGNCNGCCDAQHRCRPGTDLNACGQRAAQCLDCGAVGFACTASGTCEGVAPTCGPANCSGCCTAAGLCRFGSESDACGSGGGKCDDCASKAQGCSAGVCQGAPPPMCAPSNCGGCCDALGKCQAGSADAACGSQGSACSNCGTKSQKCTQPGSYCAAPLPCATVCSAGCCDAAGVCHAPTDTACGTQGQSCSDCKAQMKVCAPQGYCYAGTSCGSSSCAGCCTATGMCLGGADTAACGQFGSLCDNCSAKNETCRNQVCSSGSTCPGSFAGCSPDAVTEPPKASTSCSAAELALVVRMCSGPAIGCEAAFGRLLASNPACAGCLSQFVGDQAFARCAAPFLSQACNHFLTCGVACTGAVCSQCSTAERDNCQTTAGQAGGPCNGYAYGWACALAALQGPGAFCNWEMYKDAGKWLDAVGGHYCTAR